MEAAAASEEQRRRFGQDGAGRLLFPATVEEVFADGRLRLRYDRGAGGDGRQAQEPLGFGVELQEQVEARVQMPWHPKYLKENLVICLRRNMGHGKVLEGLEVRWAFVCRLIGALTRLGNYGLDGERRPMHKWYDRRLFDVLEERQVLEAYAPQAAGGTGDGAGGNAGAAEAVAEGIGGAAVVGAAAVAEEVRGASTGVLRTGEELRSAGFEVRVMGGLSAALGGAAAAGEEDVFLEQEASGGWEAETVSREVFCKWLEVAQARWGSALAAWWCESEVAEEGAVDGVRAGEDDTVADLYRRIADDVAGAWGRVKAQSAALQYAQVVCRFSWSTLEHMQGVLHTRAG